jgi:hypothetical protein
MWHVDRREGHEDLGQGRDKNDRQYEHQWFINGRMSLQLDLADTQELARGQRIPVIIMCVKWSRNVLSYINNGCYIIKGLTFFF